MSLLKSTPLFKVLNNHCGPYYSFKWPPKGEWTATRKNVESCVDGWHLTPLLSLHNWLNCVINSSNLELWRAVGDGKSDTKQSNKVAFARAKLTVRLDTSRETIKKLTLFGYKKIEQLEGAYSIEYMKNQDGFNDTNSSYIRTYTSVHSKMAYWLQIPENSQLDRNRKTAARAFFRKVCATWRISYSKAIGNL